MCVYKKKNVFRVCVIQQTPLHCRLALYPIYFARTDDSARSGSERGRRETTEKGVLKGNSMRWKCRQKREEEGRKEREQRRDHEKVERKKEERRGEKEEGSERRVPEVVLEN